MNDQPASVATRRRSRARRAWIFAAALLIACCSAELALRLYVRVRGWTPNCYAASLQLFRPHPDLGYDLRPGFRMKSGMYAISINSLGFRGPELSLVKPTSVRRIAILGESAVFGYMVSDGQEAARLVEGRLAENGRKVEIVNAGVPGYNLFQTTRRFRECVAPLSPDFVVLYLGWNDLPYIVSDMPRDERFQRRPIAPAWQRSMSRSTLYGFVVYRLLARPLRLAPADIGGVRPTQLGLAQFRENLRELGDAVRASGARMIVCSQANAAHARAAGALRAALSLKQEEIEPIIALGQLLRDELERFAHEFQADFADIYNEIAPTTEMLADYVHLTHGGEQRLADILAQRLAPLLEPATSAQSELRRRFNE